MSQQIMKQQNTRLARGLVWFAGVFSVAMLVMLCAAASNPAALAFVIMLAFSGGWRCCCIRAQSRAVVRANG